MLDICYEELDELKEDINKEYLRDYLDTWDYEDEYSHSHIEENRREFVKLANEYFKENGLPYVAKDTCDRVKIYKDKGNK